MESRALLSATPARVAAVSVLNPGIVVGSPGDPGTIESQTPRSLQIVVLSQAGAQPFVPSASLLPGTIRVDGLAVRGATITTLPDSNGDGLPDAVITVSTRGLNLPAGPGIVTVTGTTRFRANGRPVVWASAAGVDVVPPLQNPNFLQYQGYIIITNQTTRTVYESLNINTPPGGTPAPNPGNYFPVTAFFPNETYTGPGQPSQLMIQANFSLSPLGTNPFPVTFTAAQMTVSTFPPQSIIRWYLHLNTSTNQFYINNTP
jgi:hypothetical protein